MSLASPLHVLISKAERIAHSFGHEFLGLEHVLLVLLSDPLVFPLFAYRSIDRAQVEGKLKDYLVSEFVPVSKPPAALSHNDAVKRFLNRLSTASIFHPLYFMLLVFSEKDSFSVSCLESFGIASKDVLLVLSMADAPQRKDTELPLFQKTAAPLKSSETSSLLSAYTTFLNARAQDNKIDALIGRGPELKRVIQILCRRRKNNPLLLGEPGVGKTAIVEGLARQIVRQYKTLPPVLAGLKIYSLDLGALLAGTRYRGDFEERLKNLIAEIKSDPRAVLFIDEIHTLVGAGGVGQGALDASALLKPVLSDGSLRCIGATTFKDYRQYLEKDRAFLRRFQIVDVDEPSRDEAVRILQGVKGSFEKYHNLQISDEAIASAVDLTDKFIGDRRLPDKAIDAMDEAAAALQLSNPALRLLTEKDVEKTIARMAKIPAKHVTKDEKKILKGLDASLKSRIFGQDEAVGKLASSIKFARAGLRETEKTMASFLFFGPTGVGKTELARQLADLMGMKLLRFDMSEYMEKHAVSKLIGAPPGYVGYEQGGLLTEAVSQSPYAVLLLDEVEKAHTDLINVLLQVMDYGKLSDTHGKKIDFKNIILIMTTNAAAEDFQRKSIGFFSDLYVPDDTLKRFFSPEFRNRLDGIIPFKPLSYDSFDRIVEKFLSDLRAQLALHGVTLEVSYLVRKALIDCGQTSDSGARPLSRMIQEKIKMPLADEMLFGRLAKGGHVALNMLKNDIVLETFPKKVSEKMTLFADEPALF